MFRNYKVPLHFENIKIIHHLSFNSSRTENKPSPVSDEIEHGLVELDNFSLEIFKPKTYSGGHGAIINIHGGGFTVGNVPSIRFENIEVCLGKKNRLFSIKIIKLILLGNIVRIWRLIRRQS